MQCVVKERGGDTVTVTVEGTLLTAEVAAAAVDQAVSGFAAEPAASFTVYEANDLYYRGRVFNVRNVRHIRVVRRIR